LTKLLGPLELEDAPELAEFVIVLVGNTDGTVKPLDPLELGDAPEIEELVRVPVGNTDGTV